MRSIQKTLKQFLNATNAGVAPMFALFLTVILFIIGFTIDFRRMDSAKMHLQAATDSAVLAAARAYLTSSVQVKETKRQEDSQKIASDYLTANLLSSSNNFENNQIQLVFKEDGEIVGKASTKIKLIFGGLFGKSDVVLPALAAATVGDSRKLEIVLVLDTSGSMSSQNRMKQLRTASINFVNSVFDNAVYERTVQVGVVPWNATVNINMDRPGTWDASPGPAIHNSNYGNGTNQVTSFQDFTENLYPPGFSDFGSYSDSDIDDDFGSSGWLGCITATKDERKISSSGNVTPLTDVPPSKMKWPARKVAGWDPNSDCPSPMLAMSQSRPQIIKKLNQLNPSGNTHADIGLMWGYRMFSQQANWNNFFGYNSDTKPDSFHSTKSRKIMIMLTDGENTTTSSEGYSYYGWCTYTDHYKTKKNGKKKFSHTTRDCVAPEGINKEEVSGSDLNSLMLDACEVIRSKDVELFTIALDLHSYYDSTAIALLRECAGSDSHAYNIKGNELDETFQELASKALRLSK